MELDKNMRAFAKHEQHKRIKLRYVGFCALFALLLFMKYVVPMIPSLRSIGGRVMIVASGSMSPFLNMGDIIILSGTSPESVKVGDLITFDVAPRLQQQYGYPPTVTHRVISIIAEENELYFQTKGDATAADPFTVPASDLVGIYAWKIPYVGLIFMFMQTIYGMALLASYITLDVAVDYGPMWWKKRQEKEKAVSLMLKETQGVKKSLEKFSSTIAPTISSSHIILRRTPSSGTEVIADSPCLAIRRKNASNMEENSL
jgi:signal peptidase